MYTNKYIRQQIISNNDILHAALAIDLMKQMSDIRRIAGEPCAESFFREAGGKTLGT